MDTQKSPKDVQHSAHSTSPDIDADSDHHTDHDMAAAAVASLPTPLFNQPSSSPTTATAGSKRYRPAPAKTFQCRGYGECRMVFSRSEHLLRHIRKHTGERPFTCHCGKQFSRLDNLRQHAQTVHADKADQNERMMQELTSLHATMTAAGKGAPRGKRSQNAHAASAAAAAASASNMDGSMPSMTVKQEDLPMSMRPGTSTGYEGDDDFFRTSTGWNDSRHSFRDPGQSFRVPPASSTAAAHLHHGHAQHAGQSFLAPASTPFSFSLPDIGHPPGPASRPGTSSRPPTAGGSADRSLPPISAIVAASGAPALPLPNPAHQLPYPPLVVPQQREQPRTPLTSSYVLPLPTPSGPYAAYRDRRPSTATRPGTAPASYYYGPGPTLPPLVGARPELSLSLATGHGRRGPDRLADVGGYEPPSPAGPYGDSPFSFHAPASSTPSSATFPAERERDAPPPPVANPRKRPYAGSDDGDHDHDDDGCGPHERAEHPYYGPYREPRDVRPYSSGRRPGTAGYDYGGESRPQSRRLSVMELCNDADAEPAARPALPLPGGPSRPTTSSGIISGAEQLALYDRTPSPTAGPALAGVGPGGALGAARPSILAGAPPTAGGADAPRASPAASPAAAGGLRGAGASPFGGGAVLAPVQRELPPALGGREQQRGERAPQPSASPRAAAAAASPGSSSPLARAAVLRGSPPGVRRTPGGSGSAAASPAGYGWSVSGSPSVSPRGRSPASVGSPSGVSVGMRA